MKLKKNENIENRPYLKEFDKFYNPPYHFFYIAWIKNKFASCTTHGLDVFIRIFKQLINLRITCQFSWLVADLEKIEKHMKFIFLQHGLCRMARNVVCNIFQWQFILFETPPTPNHQFCFPLPQHVVVSHKWESKNLILHYFIPQLELQNGLQLQELLWRPFHPFPIHELTPHLLMHHLDYKVPNG